MVEDRLPVELRDGLIMNDVQASNFGQKYHETYASAEPYPHIVFDNFLPVEIAEASLEDFPLPSVNEYRFEVGYGGQHKRQIAPANCNQFSRDMFAFFNSAAMVKFVEGLTGIRKLIPDPHFFGGGYHETSRGGLLGIHADFRVHEFLNLQRRINVIIYLNKDWQEEWGGALELWDQAMKGKVQSILPVFNRCAIFNTDLNAFHGHPDPLNCPETRTRRSIALYYYTASENIYKEVPNLKSIFRARPSDAASLKKELLKAKIDTYLYDWLPPVLSRRIEIVRKAWKRLRRRTMSAIRKYVGS